MLHVGGNVVVSQFEPQPLRHFIMGNASAKQQKVKEDTACVVEEAENYEELVELLPWIEFMDTKHAFVALASEAVAA